MHFALEQFPADQYIALGSAVHLLADEMELESYLQRSRYSGSRSPHARTLRTLHRTHLLAVPFENLDTCLGRFIVLDGIIWKILSLQ